MCQFSISDYPPCGHVVFERPQTCLFKGSELLCESHPMVENRHQHCCPKCSLFPTRRRNTIPAPSSSHLALRKAYSLPTLKNSSAWKPYRPAAQAPVEWRRTRMVHKLMVDRVKEQVFEKAREVGMPPAEMPVPRALLWSIREDGEEMGCLSWSAEMTADRASCASGYAETVDDGCWVTEVSLPKSAGFRLEDGRSDDGPIVSIYKGTEVSEVGEKSGPWTVKEPYEVKTTAGGKYPIQNISEPY